MAWAVSPLFAKQSGSSAVRSTSRDSKVVTRQVMGEKVSEGSATNNQKLSEDKKTTETVEAQKEMLLTNPKGTSYN